VSLPGDDDRLDAGGRTVDRRVVYIDSIGGIAGDMLLSALLDAGASEAALLEVPDRLGLAGVDVRIRRVMRHAISALHITVEDTGNQGGGSQHHDGDAHRSWRVIRHQLATADLNDAVRSTALAVLKRLADAEARIHGIDSDDVHFHEIGAVDTLVDIVGVATLLDDIGPARIVCSPLPMGRGTVKAAHGVLPLPTPATAALLIGVPVYGVDLQAETVTPTGAALATTLADSWGPLPAMTLEQVGYGAGTANFAARANLVRVMLGTAAPSAVPEATGEVVLLETNLDDLSPELIPDAAEQCFAAGALDVWSTPVTMKKGRPGLVFSTLARPEMQAAVATAMLRHTSALGVRAVPLRRYELDREQRTVTVDGHEVRVKLGRLNGEIVNIAPEHDDCAEVARIGNVPVKSIWAAALVAAQELT
jgi:pyridinium-3,5-bisthiocarboxylic acid mononucleotide nickel chelatase